MSQESFRGNELKLLREELGLTREDVFRKLRIPSDVIKQIETDEMTQMPSMTYCIGFIKTYCQFLGANPEPFIAEVVMAHQKPKGILNQAIRGESEDRPVWLREAIMWTTIAAIIVLGWTTYHIIFSQEPSEQSNRVQAESVDTRIPQFPMR